MNETCTPPPGVEDFLQELILAGSNSLLEGVSDKYLGPNCFVWVWMVAVHAALC